MKFNLFISFQITVRRKWQRNDEREVFYDRAEFEIPEISGKDLSVAVDATSTFSESRSGDATCKKNVVIYRVGSDLYSPVHEFDKSKCLPIAQVETIDGTISDLISEVEKSEVGVEVKTTENQLSLGREGKSFREDGHAGYAYNEKVTKLSDFLEKFSSSYISLPKLPSKTVCYEVPLTSIKDDVEEKKKEVAREIQKAFDNFLVIDGCLHVKTNYPSVEVIFDDDNVPIQSVLALRNRDTSSCVVPMKWNYVVPEIFGVTDCCRVDVRDIPEDHPSMNDGLYVEHAKNILIRYSRGMLSHMKSNIADLDTEYFNAYKNLRDGLSVVDPTDHDWEKPKNPIGEVDLSEFIEVVKEVVDTNEKVGKKVKDAFYGRNLKVFTKIIEVLEREMKDDQDLKM